TTITTDPVQAAYGMISCAPHNETTPLAQLDYWGGDFNGTPGIGGMGSKFYTSINGPNSFFNKQFHSLYAWRSVANATYNALQITMRKRASHGLQFDFNYTLSKSIDLASDAERIQAWRGLGSEIVNSWYPNAGRGISDFDTR